MNATSIDSHGHMDTGGRWWVIEKQSGKEVGQDMYGMESINCTVHVDDSECPSRGYNIIIPWYVCTGK